MLKRVCGMLVKSPNSAALVPGSNPGGATYKLVTLGDVYNMSLLQVPNLEKQG